MRLLELLRQTGVPLNSWILAHGSGIDDVLIFALAAVVVLGLRLITRRSSDADPGEEDSEPS